MNDYSGDEEDVPGSPEIPMQNANVSFLFTGHLVCNS